MDIVGLESLDEDTIVVYQKSELIDQLESIRTRVATEGMTRDDAQLLERIAPGIFDGINVNKFTMRPSTTNQAVAVEAIDWKRAATMVGAALAIITVIGKIISWLSDSLTTTGSGAGGIKDISETNSKIEKRCVDNVEAEVVTEDSLQKVGRETVRKIGKLSNVNTHYINQLVERVDGGHVVNSNGKQIAPNDVSNAVNKYVDAVKRTRATDRDAQLHALLGYMLLSKQGGIPLSLIMLDWKGGGKGDKLNKQHIMALEHSIELTNELIDEIGKLGSAIEKTKHTGLQVLEDDRHIDGKVGDGGLLYGLMSKSNEVLIRVRNTLETNSSLRATYSPSMVTEINGTRPDSATMGRIIPEFNTDVKKVLEEVKSFANTYISFWDNSDYQNYTSKVDAAKYTDLIIALADPKARDELAKFYGMVYSTSSSDATPKSEGALKSSNDRLKHASAVVSSIQKRATKLENSWLIMPFAQPSSNGFNPDNVVAYTPLTQLRILIETASALSRRTSELTSVINMALRDADRAINMTAKMK